MYKLKLIFIIVFLSGYSLCFAQTLQFENYTTKDGLLSDEVYKIFQDKKGYLWMFTNYGAMKYNGKKFEQTLKNLPFNESFIYSYYENNQGQLWVANSNSKIYSVRNDSAFLIKGTEKISEKLNQDVCEILELYVDKINNIYISTKRGAYRLDENLNYAASLIKESTKNDSIFVSLIDFNNEIISCIDEHYRSKKLNIDNFTFYIKYSKNGNQKKSFKVKVNGKSNSFNPIYFKRFNQDIYFLIQDNIVKVNSDRSIKYLSFPSFILNYTKDKNGHLWVGVLNDGLYELDKNDSIINHYLKGKTINHVLIDSQNGLWASSDGLGLFHCKNLNEFHFNDDELFGKGINFIKKIDNEILLANPMGDIFIIKNDEVTSIKSDYKTKSDVLDVIKYKTGYIVCYRFQMDFLEIEPKIKRIKLPLILPAFYPLKLFNVMQDTLLCISRHKILFLNNGISSLNNENVITKLDHKISSCEYRNKNLLFATEDGVYELINGKLVQPGYLLPTKNCKMVKIVKDVFDNFWFCSTGHGIFKLTNENKLIQYTVENGLPSNIINSISFNTDNSVLLSTNTGLYHSSKFKKWIEVYPEQVYSAIGLKNDIYFIANNGLIIEKNCKQIEEQSVYFNLAKVLVNNKLINMNEISDLSYDQNSLEFGFDVISFSSNVLDIIYQLNGPKSQIAISKNQDVILQNLPSGNYTLTASLVAQNNRSNSIIIPFSIMPAFWQTNWFITICVIICIYSGWCILKFFRNKEHKKNEANRLITEYKLIALKAQINPHFMSNCLTAIQNLIINGKVNEANQYLAKFSFLVRQILNFSTRSMVTLKEELEITQLNIELEQLRFENKFSFQLDIDQSIDLQKIMLPPLIFQPIIENAIWHGLLPLKKIRKGILKIKIGIVDQTLEIIVEDNGVGVKTINQDISNLRDSRGIQLIKQRIQNLNVLNNTSVGSFNFEDVKDSNDNLMGLRIKIVLPLIKTDTIL